MPSARKKPKSGRIAFRQHEADFGGLLEAVPDALVGVDRAGVIRYINPGASSLFRYARDELVGLPIETLVPDSVRPGHPAHRDDYFAGQAARRPHGGPESADDRKRTVAPKCLRGRQQDGTEFPMNLSLSQIDTDDGPLVIAAVRDMTEHEKAVEKLDRVNRLAQIVAPGQEANISIGSDGIITSWNLAAERLYGFSSEEVIGKRGWATPPDQAPG